MGANNKAHDWSDKRRMKGGLVCARCELQRKPVGQHYRYLVAGAWILERPLCVGKENEDEAARDGSKSETRP